MGRRSFLALLVCCAAAVGASVSSAASERGIARLAVCTYEEKQARTATLRRRERAARAQKAAYFRRQKNPAKRKAFARTQEAGLRKLRAAAACSVPALPQSSGASCSFTLEPYPHGAALEAAAGISPQHLGRHDPAAFVPSTGRVRVLVLLVEFPDAPATDGSAAQIAGVYAPDPAWFAEVSYGRYTLDVAAADRWFRMPGQTGSYSHVYPGIRAYAADAVAAADPWVDFAQYHAVFVVPTSRWGGGQNTAYATLPGRGVPSADGEVRAFVLVAADVARFGSGAARVAAHEFLHAVGLPDLRFDDGSTGAWDPMGATAGGAAPPGVHLLGWQKWKLGWLDPIQLTCHFEPGAVEETLSALATPGGKKLLLVPTGPHTTYALEARMRIGADREICEEGVLVYEVDSALANGQTRDGRGLVAVKGPRRCWNGAAGALRTGESFEDDRVKVEVLARDAASFRVRVTRK